MSGLLLDQESVKKLIVAHAGRPLTNLSASVSPALPADGTEGAQSILLVSDVGLVLGTLKATVSGLVAPAEVQVRVSVTTPSGPVSAGYALNASGVYQLPIADALVSAGRILSVQVSAALSVAQSGVSLSVKATGATFQTYAGETWTPTTGTTAQRPTTRPQGYQFYDTTLQKPVWWDGAGQWRDGAGTVS